MTQLKNSCIRYGVLLLLCKLLLPPFSSPLSLSPYLPLSPFPSPSLPPLMSISLSNRTPLWPPFFRHAISYQRCSPLLPPPTAPGRASPRRVQSAGASGRPHRLDGFQVFQEDLLWRHELPERRLLVLCGKASWAFPFVVSLFWFIFIVLIGLLVGCSFSLW